MLNWRPRREVLPGSNEQAGRTIFWGNTRLNRCNHASCTTQVRGAGGGDAAARSARGSDTASMYSVTQSTVPATPRDTAPSSPRTQTPFTPSQSGTQKTHDSGLNAAAEQSSARESTQFAQLDADFAFTEQVPYAQDRGHSGTTDTGESRQGSGNVIASSRNESVRDTVRSLASELEFLEVGVGPQGIPTSDVVHDQPTPEKRVENHLTLPSEQPFTFLDAPRDTTELVVDPDQIMPRTNAVSPFSAARASPGIQSGICETADPVLSEEAAIAVLGSQGVDEWTREHGTIDQVDGGSRTKPLSSEQAEGAQVVGDVLESFGMEVEPVEIPFACSTPPFVDGANVPPSENNDDFRMTERDGESTSTRLEIEPVVDEGLDEKQVADGASAVREVHIAEAPVLAFFEQEITSAQESSDLPGKDVTESVDSSVQDKHLSVDVIEALDGDLESMEGFAPDTSRTSREVSSERSDRLVSTHASVYQSADLEVESTALCHGLNPVGSVSSATVLEVSKAAKQRDKHVAEDIDHVEGTKVTEESKSDSSSGKDEPLLAASSAEKPGSAEFQCDSAHEYVKEAVASLASAGPMSAVRGTEPDSSESNVISFNDNSDAELDFGSVDGGGIFSAEHESDPVTAFSDSAKIAFPATDGDQAETLQTNTRGQPGIGTCGLPERALEATENEHIPFEIVEAFGSEAEGDAETTIAMAVAPSFASLHQTESETAQAALEDPLASTTAMESSVFEPSLHLPKGDAIPTELPGPGMADVHDIDVDPICTAEESTASALALEIEDVYGHCDEMASDLELNDNRSASDREANLEPKSLWFDGDTQGCDSANLDDEDMAFFHASGSLEKEDDAIDGEVMALGGDLEADGPQELQEWAHGLPITAATAPPSQEVQGEVIPAQKSPPVAANLDAVPHGAASCATGPNLESCSNGNAGASQPVYVRPPALLVAASTLDAAAASSVSKQSSKHASSERGGMPSLSMAGSPAVATPEKNDIIPGGRPAGGPSLLPVYTEVMAHHSGSTSVRALSDETDMFANRSPLSHQDTSSPNMGGFMARSPILSRLSEVASNALRNSQGIPVQETPLLDDIDYSDAYGFREQSLQELVTLKSTMHLQESLSSSLSPAHAMQLQPPPSAKSAADTTQGPSFSPVPMAPIQMSSSLYSPPPNASGSLGRSTNSRNSAEVSVESVKAVPFPRSAIDMHHCVPPNVHAVLAFSANSPRTVIMRPYRKVNLNVLNRSAPNQFGAGAVKVHACVGDLVSSMCPAGVEALWQGLGLVHKLPSEPPSALFSQKPQEASVSVLSAWLQYSENVVASLCAMTPASASDTRLLWMLLCLEIKGRSQEVFTNHTEGFGWRSSTSLVEALIGNSGGSGGVRKTSVGLMSKHAYHLSAGGGSSNVDPVAAMHQLEVALCGGRTLDAARIAMHASMYDVALLLVHHMNNKSNGRDQHQEGEGMEILREVIEKRIEPDSVLYLFLNGYAEPSFEQLEKVISASANAKSKTASVVWPHVAALCMSDSSSGKGFGSSTSAKTLKKLALVLLRHGSPTGFVVCALLQRVCEGSSQAHSTTMNRWHENASHDGELLLLLRDFDNGNSGDRRGASVLSSADRVGILVACYLLRHRALCTTHEMYVVVLFALPDVIELAHGLYEFANRPDAAISWLSWVVSTLETAITTEDFLRLSDDVRESNSQQRQQSSFKESLERIVALLGVIQGRDSALASRARQLLESEETQEQTRERFAHSQRETGIKSQGEIVVPPQLVVSEPNRSTAGPEESEQHVPEVQILPLGKTNAEDEYANATTAAAALVIRSSSSKKSLPSPPAVVPVLASPPPTIAMPPVTVGASETDGFVSERTRSSGSGGSAGARTENWHLHRGPAADEAELEDLLRDDEDEEDDEATVTGTDPLSLYANGKKGPLVSFQPRIRLGLNTVDSNAAEDFAHQVRSLSVEDLKNQAVRQEITAAGDVVLPSTGLALADVEDRTLGEQAFVPVIDEDQHGSMDQDMRSSDSPRSPRTLVPSFSEEPTPVPLFVPAQLPSRKATQPQARNRFSRKSGLSASTAYAPYLQQNSVDTNNNFSSLVVKPPGLGLGFDGRAALDDESITGPPLEDADLSGTGQSLEVPSQLDSRTVPSLHQETKQSEQDTRENMDDSVDDRRRRRWTFGLAADPASQPPGSDDTTEIADVATPSDAVQAPSAPKRDGEAGLQLRAQPAASSKLQKERDVTDASRKARRASAFAGFGEKIRSLVGAPKRAHMGVRNDFYWNDKLQRYVVRGEEEQVEAESVIPPPPMAGAAITDRTRKASTPSAFADMLAEPRLGNPVGAGSSHSRTASVLMDESDRVSDAMLDKPAGSHLPEQAHPHRESSPSGVDSAPAAVAQFPGEPLARRVGAGRGGAARGRGQGGRGGARGGNVSARTRYVDTFNASQSNLSGDTATSAGAGGPSPGQAPVLPLVPTPTVIPPPAGFTMFIPKPPPVTSVVNGDSGDGGGHEQERESGPTSPR
ncbi:hypothetical protein FVE85_5554 [Porphyridium purpureum]|uniref:Uncharacterized protein n=1 Tax=Porphyridium purpureum TaxID=35688 RepID=A0A5J4Z230_PORPP|nr:hypothetical protein FVE85_5554 [Porphyridium purpureum]|eukprot:POR9092..scf295_1